MFANLQSITIRSNRNTGPKEHSKRFHLMRALVDQVSEVESSRRWGSEPLRTGLGGSEGHGQSSSFAVDTDGAFGIH